VRDVWNGSRTLLVGVVGCSLLMGAGAATATEVGRILVAATDEFPRNGEGSMVVLRDGSILMLYGAQSGTGDWAIGAIREIRSADGGQTWSEPRTLFTDAQRSLFQPSLTRMANGDLGLTHTSLLPQRGAFKVFRRSRDDGRTWSEPVRISDPSLPHTTGPWDKLYTLSNGRVVALLHALLVDNITKNAGPRGTYAMFSDDHGQTWKRAPREGTLRVEDEPHDRTEWGFWEPALIEYAPGKLLLMARTSTGWLYESRSEDYGSTWTEPVRSTVPNPIAPPVLTKVPGSDTLVLLHNPRVAMGRERLGGHRTVLAYRTSRDAGRSWSEPQTILEANDGAEWHDYPAILWHGDRLHLACRHIEIFDTNRWTRVNLQYLALPTSRFEPGS
jgi:predicted neuraminidase